MWWQCGKAKQAVMLQARPVDKCNIIIFIVISKVQFNFVLLLEGKRPRFKFSLRELCA